MKPLIVTVEDDNVISELVGFNLQNEGYEVLAFRDGRSMFENKSAFKNLTLFVLDIMLPDMDGFEICAMIKQDPQFDMVPIIMLTARGSETDKVKAFETGADDYITKPFGVREFLARVNTNVRRFIKQTGGSLRTEIPNRFEEEKQKGPAVLYYGGIHIDDEKHRVFKGDTEIEMTHREYELLKFMMQNRGIAYSRDALLTNVWGYEYAGETRTVDVHIRQLRRKIEEDDANPVIIETVRGRGYRFTER
jgi:two-component system alkaline phosphatase synthesis response regulator PhoP